MANPYHIQHRGPQGWQTVPALAGETTYPIKQGVIEFKRKADAEQAALEFSVTNEGHIFRVVQKDESLTGVYPVYMSGQRLLYDHYSLILMPEANAAVLVLNLLIEPALDNVPETALEEARCAALGKLVSAWADRDPKRIQRVLKAALVACSE